MDWQNAFYVSATLVLWLVAILTVWLAMEMYRVVTEVRRRTKDLSRLGLRVRYTLMKWIVNVVGGDRSG